MFLPSVKLCVMGLGLCLQYSPGYGLFLLLHSEVSFLLAQLSLFHQQRHQSLLPSQAISVVCIYVYWDGVTDFIVSHKEYLTLKSSISYPWVEAKNQDEGR